MQCSAPRGWPIFGASQKWGFSRTTSSLGGRSELAPWGVRPDARCRADLSLKVCGFSTSRRHMLLYLSAPHPARAPCGRVRRFRPVSPLPHHSGITNDSYPAASVGGVNRRSPTRVGGPSLSARFRTQARTPSQVLSDGIEPASPRVGIYLSPGRPFVQVVSIVQNGGATKHDYRRPPSRSARR
jgi:hypothetical protein